MEKHVERNFWIPWHDLGLLQSRMNRLFDSRLPRSQTARSNFPPINAWADEHKVYLTVEAPGLEVTDLEVAIHGKNVTIRGVRKEPEKKEGEVFYQQERATGAFQRALELPYAVDADRVQATFQRGILTVVLQRPEAEKPRKITVQSA